MLNQCSLPPWARLDQNCTGGSPTAGSLGFSRSIIHYALVEKTCSSPGGLATGEATD